MFLCFSDDETLTPPLRSYLGDWFEHHEGFGRDLSTLRRAARLTYDVGRELEDRGRELQRVLPLPGRPPAAQQADARTTSGEDFLAEGPWKGGWMVFADGLRDDVGQRAARRPPAALRP